MRAPDGPTHENDAPSESALAALAYHADGHEILTSAGRPEDIADTHGVPTPEVPEADDVGPASMLTSELLDDDGAPLP